MKVCILFALLALTVSSPILGQCSMAPKNRPISCYEGQVLGEDIPELMDLLERFKGDGDDDVFADYLGDMLDKKDFREGKQENNEEEKQLLGRCGMAPKYLPFECYEINVLRRDRNTLKSAYEQYHESDLEKYNSIYVPLIEKKWSYFGISDE